MAERLPSEPTLTERIHQYRAGTISWGDLILIVGDCPWRDPDLPPSDDWNAWDPPPDTFQDGTFGEVTGAHVDGLLTDEEYELLLTAFEASFNGGRGLPS